MKAVAYYRQNKTWKNYLGKTGKVVVSTMIRVSSKAQEKFLPYSYAVVEFADKQRAEFMGVPGEELQVGDEIICVLRKIAVTDKAGVIAYGIKIKKL